HRRRHPRQVGVTRMREDRGDARAYVVATPQRHLAHAHALDVGDRVPAPGGEDPRRDAEVAGAHALPVDSVGCMQLRRQRQQREQGDDQAAWVWHWRTLWNQGTSVRGRARAIRDTTLPSRHMGERGTDSRTENRMRIPMIALAALLAGGRGAPDDGSAGTAARTPAATATPPPPAASTPAQPAADTTVPKRFQGEYAADTAACSSPGH